MNPLMHDTMEIEKIYSNGFVEKDYLPIPPNWERRKIEAKWRRIAP
jgi:hypothetical protein